ncbi:MAG: AAC(3) family N-acetyltransferase [Scytonema sp. RU_4_4]|nr:AAC(3) family N-acetyltransferase [Scytonema sp. RU_4_4]
MNKPLSKNELTHQLLNLGVQPGGVLVVHTAFSKVAPVEQGSQGLIEALIDVLGSQGTLVMPTMTDDDDNPFDPAKTPCLGMGIVADMFWRSPGVLRSNSPHAFAAIGAKAAEITAPHPVDVPHGLDSPIGRVYSLDGQVLLLGVGHDANTTIHLAETMAGVRYLRPKYVTILNNGHPEKYHYREIDHCCENFSLLDTWLESNQQQVSGVIGYAQARLARSRHIVEATLSHLRENETIFLHTDGSCGECNEAIAGLHAAQP